MPPKTTWGNPTIEILNGDNWEPLVVFERCTPLSDGPAPQLSDLNRQIGSLTFTLKLSAEAQRILNRAIEAYWERRRKLPAIRVRTGITPKRGRSRRKQRFTRLRRRAKRQRK